MRLRLTPVPVDAVAPPAAISLAAVSLAAMHRCSFPEDPWDEAALERILSLSGTFGWLAWQADDPIGFLLARDLGDEVEILSLGVMPGWRRHGAAVALLRAAAAEAARRHIGSVVLEVAEDNEAARRLYAVEGFTQVGRRPRYYQRPVGLADALILRRGIATSPKI